MREEYPLFAQTLDQLREVQGLDLASYLVMPVQRVPRYRMLLDEMVKTLNPKQQKIEQAQIRAQLLIARGKLDEANCRLACQAVVKGPVKIQPKGK